MLRKIHKWGKSTQFDTTPLSRPESFIGAACASTLLCSVFWALSLRSTLKIIGNIVRNLQLEASIKRSKKQSMLTRQCSSDGLRLLDEADDESKRQHGIPLLGAMLITQVSHLET
jgi:hypothetical protein